MLGPPWIITFVDQVGGLLSWASALPLPVSLKLLADLTWRKLSTDGFLASVGREEQLSLKAAWWEVLCGPERES